MGVIITIGDVQDTITKEFQGDLEDYINEIGRENPTVDEAWFWVHMKFWPHGVWTKGAQGGDVHTGHKTYKINIVACPTLPPKILATACYHVNYRSGKLTRLWMLPPDTQRIVQLAGEHGYIEPEYFMKGEGPMRDTEILEDAQDIKPAVIHRPH